MNNRFAARCVHCDQWIKPGLGLLDKHNGQWIVSHDGPCPDIAPPPANPVTEPGMYAHAGVFYKVQLSRAGRLYAKRVVITDTGAGHEVVFVYQAGAVSALAATDRLTADQAREFGMLYGTCCNCGITLTDERSVAAGYGPVCARNNGWAYPTTAEAAKILAAAS
jgi:hypothetical protein